MPRRSCTREEFEVICTLLLGPMKHQQKTAREPRRDFMIHCCVLYHSPEPFCKTRSARVSVRERCRRRAYFFHEATGERERERFLLGFATFPATSFRIRGSNENRLASFRKHSQHIDRLVERSPSPFDEISSSRQQIVIDSSL